MDTQLFNPAAWAARHLDLFHEPSCEAYRSLNELAIPDLEQVYHALSTTPDWQDFVWDTFADLVERELAMEL